jgi:alpha-glucuronidase
MNRLLPAQLVFLLGFAVPMVVVAEDGYRLWLRNAPLPSDQRAAVTMAIRSIVGPTTGSPITQSALTELQSGLSGMLGRPLSRAGRIEPGSVVVVTRDAVPSIESTEIPFETLGAEGFALRRATVDGQAIILVTANTDTGLLYGVFELLRQIGTGADLRALDVTEAPRTRLRLLNHWDNIDRHVERGYAGQSIWDWWRLPDIVDPRYTDYARANASIGINGVALNNVNANALFLTPRYLAKVATIADVLRPWGMQVYLSVRWSAPREIGGLETADPLDDTVRAWWQGKADEIYAEVPDFGGFLVKANSEGQPGPQEYGRSHAEGANMLAAALAPHGGRVMWRAFVYSQDDPEDRVRQAYTEFKPLDGQFADNVLVQVKNGPLDFQPREPFHPLFGAMPQTPLMMEFQVTLEYLGFATHLTWLGQMWEEVLQAETHSRGPDTLVANEIDRDGLDGLAGVANIGVDRNWTGHPFGQANWFALGRLAWNPQADADAIAREWLALTFSRDPAFIGPALAMMRRSRDAVVDYMTPLGLAHLMGTGHHYGPAPWVSELSRPEWNPWYYHRADQRGIGLDRTASGSNAIEQYAAPVAEQFGDLAKVPDEYLLWFHRLPWDYTMRSGQSLWEELLARYDHGVAEVAAMQETWAGLAPFVDPQRYNEVTDLLAVQRREAQWWRDACIAYFQRVSGLDLPEGVTPPPQSLEHYQSLSFPDAPGN